MSAKIKTPQAKIFRVNKKTIRSATPEDQLNSLPFLKINKKSKVGLLLIHGFSVTPAIWRGYLPSFLGKNYSVYAPVLPGHSQTPEDLDKTTHQDWLDSVISAYDLLAKDCQEIYCIGHSMGGSLALELSLQRPIKKLILLAPAVYLFLQGKFSSWGVLIARFFRLNFSIGPIAGDIKNNLHFVICYRTNSLKSLRQLAISMKKAEQILFKVDTDCLILHGLHDHKIPSHQSKKILQKIKSQNKNLILLENSYHEIPIDNQSEFVLQKILEAIAQK